MSVFKLSLIKRKGNPPNRDVLSLGTKKCLKENDYKLKWVEYEIGVGANN